MGLEKIECSRQYIVVGSATKQPNVWAAWGSWVLESWTGEYPTST